MFIFNMSNTQKHSYANILLISAYVHVYKVSLKTVFSKILFWKLISRLLGGLESFLKHHKNCETALFNVCIVENVFLRKVVDQVGRT